ncbi:16S rRNA (guanine(966)-N(2))-methyltransferase RsmD [Nocardioides sp.]|uniref:16S rRNA (guanine(966)-N(2))-methyltransferase RsmD n=1 Tax=Nocardioides sp. TaxID=35761 RepID=UPI00271E53FD|nr:16S rRNA (guanine(966)-N(2))-methyltransferase RsmD [Nocardioides sp.]MDO9455458.1 16S rRNA (guanine(966)-N(2))-methyltransferase RsmD [Nocardioides sp.]
MTRIIAGQAKGRRLRTPPGEHTRPTTDRVREALFSAVESWCGSLHGLRFLDLYAGSGAVGLEAWSRGAEAVTFVESDKATAALVLGNARDLGFAGADVQASRVVNALAGPPRRPYDIVFSDPPYPLPETDLADDLRRLADGWLAPDALVVLERSRRSPEPTWPAGIEGERSKRYGETTLWYGHAP